ncbi:hypothetical protein GCM10028805_61810 [Spirosoma harenae]
MSQSELLSFVLTQLNRNGIPFMVTGSVVSSLQGEPRSTHDIDIIVILDFKSVYFLVDLFPKETFYVNPDSIIDAIERRSMFNLIDMFSGNKVDFWLLTEEPYDQARFSRRQKVDVLGIENFYITSPEDTILSKLRWAKLAGGSEKQLIDAVRVFEMQFDRLDVVYVKHWIDELSLQAEWQALISRAEPY